MKKKICLYSLILFLLLPPLAAKSDDLDNEGYVSDILFLNSKTNTQKLIVQDTQIDNESAQNLQKIDDNLPENKSEEDEDNQQDTKTDKSPDSSERPLYKKLLEKGIIRTDIPSYLLDEELTFNPKKGPVKKFQLFAAYNGAISSNWDNGDYDTKYTNNFFQLGIMGNIRGTNNDFKLIVNPLGAHGRNYMQNFVADAYVVNNSIPHHQVVIGYSRNQVGKEGGSSSYILPFIMRSQIARNFGSTRALGVRLIGSYDLVDYNLAFNSSDRYFRKWFAGPEFTGWVDLKPFGKTNGKYGNLVIGGGLNAGKNETHYTVGSVYVGYKYKKLWTRFEYGIADGYNGSNVVDKKAQGFYGIVGYKITPRLQIIARYDQFDPDRDVSHNLKREYTAGINWFIKGQALRLILNYVFCQNQNAPNSHRIMVGTQILL